MTLDSKDADSKSLDSLTDSELIHQIRTGNAAMLGILYDRYSSLVYRLALRILTDSQEAEDLTQEVFLNLWRSTTYNPDRGSLSSFLTTLTRSRAIDRLRSHKTRTKALHQWGQAMVSQPSTPTPFDVASIQQRSDYVREALGQLPEKQRRILELAYYDGLSQSEISAQLDIPLGTVKTWSRQGLLTLRKTLQDLIE